MASHFNKENGILIEESLNESSGSANKRLLMSIGSITKKVIAGAVLAAQITGAVGIAAVVGSAVNLYTQNDQSVMTQPTVINGHAFDALSKFELSHDDYAYTSDSYQTLKTMIEASHSTTTASFFEKDIVADSQVYDVHKWNNHVSQAISYVNGMREDSDFLQTLSRDQQEAFDSYIEAFDAQTRFVNDGANAEGVINHYINKTVFTPSLFGANLSDIEDGSRHTNEFAILSSHDFLRSSIPAYDISKSTTPVLTVNDTTNNVHLLNHEFAQFDEYAHFVQAHEELHLTINDAPILDHDLQILEQSISDLTGNFTEAEKSQFTQALSSDIRTLLDEVIADAWGIVATGQAKGVNLSEQIEDYRDANYALYFDYDHNTSGYLDQINFERVMASDNSIDTLTEEIINSSIVSQVIKDTLIRYEHADQMVFIGKDNPHAGTMSEMAKAISPQLHKANATSLDGERLAVQASDRSEFHAKVENSLSAFVRYGGAYESTDHNFKILYNLQGNDMSFTPTKPEQLRANFDQLNKLGISKATSAKTDQTDSDTGGSINHRHNGGQDSLGRELTPRNTGTCPKVDTASLSSMCPPAQAEKLSMNKAALDKLLASAVEAPGHKSPSSDNDGPKM